MILSMNYVADFQLSRFLIQDTYLSSETKSLRKGSDTKRKPKYLKDIYNL